MLPAFVKKYDFRGVYDKDITDKDAYYLGLALLKTLPLKKVLIGWDTRVSSKNLAMQFIHALQQHDIDISYVAKCPIDYVTAGANAGDYDLSIMFTGSHNPWNWTGLLMHTKGGDSIQGELVTKIVEQYYEAQKADAPEGSADLARCIDATEVIEKIYAERIKTLIPLDQITPMNVLVDIGDGSGSKSLSLLEKLLPQVTFTRLHDRQLYDGDSAHIADPSEMKNMQDLMDEMLKPFNSGMHQSVHPSAQGRYNAGFAFDSDADRVLAIDEKGNYLNGALLGSAMSEIFIKLGLPDKRFGYAVDCGPSMHNTLTEISKATSAPAAFDADVAKKTPPIAFDAIPVGRSIMRQLLRDEKIDFAVENVGHFYCKDFFMTDSGVFSLAVILYWISMNGALSTLLDIHPDGYREQVFIPVEKINEHTEEALHTSIKTLDSERKIEVDGVRYEFFEGDRMVTWYAIRKSGYEPIVKYYFGSLEEEQFDKMKETLDLLVIPSEAEESHSTHLSKTSVV